MMKGFEDVSITWGGDTYVVPADGQLLLVAKIECALKEATGKPAVAALLDREGGGPSYAALSMGLGAALRHAGADVTDPEIYLAIQADMAASKADVAMMVQSTIMTLLSIVSPPIIEAMNAPVNAGKKPKAKTGA